MADQQPWNGLVDLHSHVIPGVDDGASDDAESLKMLARFEEEGVAIVAATPHAHHCPPELVEPEVARLNRLAGEAGLAVRIVPGMEIRYSSDVVQRVREGIVLPLNHTRYLLLELFLSGGWPSRLLNVIDELQAAGYRPVLAHAERYPDVQRDPWKVRELIELGVPIQLNADSIAGPSERAAQPAAEYLLKHRLAHIIASDSHHARWRPPRVQAAYERVAELVGDERARQMQATASRIVRGLPVHLPEPIESDD